MFHCAAREPGTGSAKTGDAENSIAASVSSVASDDPEPKLCNPSKRIGSMQQFGQKDGCACVFLQRVAHKAGRLVCAKGAIIIVHDLKGQFAAT
jgi:hypothetical protein